MFIDDLKLSPEDREKLSKLGSRDALAILLMRKASPAAFDAYVGQERVQQIVDALQTGLTEAERELLEAPRPSPRALGARLRKKPSPKSRERKNK